MEEGKLLSLLPFALGKNFFDEMREADLKSLLEIDCYERMGESFRACLRNCFSPVTEERLLSIHASCVPSGGRFRDGLLKRGEEFWGVPAERISIEVKRFLNYFEHFCEDGILKAAIAHFWFSAIRPFAFGNGVVARVLSDMLISRAEKTSCRLYALHSAIERDKEGYFAALSSAQRGSGEITEWILWFLQTMRVAMKEASERVRFPIRRAAWKLRLGAYSLNERERRLVDFLLEEKNSFGGVSSSEWASWEKISHDSSLRDLTGLLKKGICEISGKGKMRRYRLKEDYRYSD